MKVKGILMRLMLVIIVPMLVLTVILTYLSANSMADALKNETIDSLERVATSVDAAFDVIDNRNFSIQNGDLIKGAINFSKNTELIDSFTEGNDMEITVFYGDVRYASSLVDEKTGERIVGTRSNPEVAEKVLAGEKYTDTNCTLNNKQYYVYYQPLTDNDNHIIGMLFVGRPTETIDKLITNKVLTVVVAAVVLFAVIIIMAVFVISRIANAVIMAEKQVRHLAKGDIGKVKINENMKKRQDEIGTMARGVDALGNRLKEIVGDLQESMAVLNQTGGELESMASQTSMNADEISRAIEDISRGAAGQAEEIENATVEVNAMGDIIEDITDEMRKMDESSSEMAKAGEESVKIIEALNISNDHTTEAINKVGAQIKETDESVNNIKEAVSLITAIADETNLLSLNASIEAARAGEAGRGFAVVAAQIQKLAEESNNSAQRIEQVIAKLAEDSRNSMEIMANVEKMVAEQQIKLNDTKERFVKVNEGIREARQKTSEINDKAKQCNESKVKVEEVVENLSAIAQENAAATEQTTATMEELNSALNMLEGYSKNLVEISEKLSEGITIFKL